MQQMFENITLFWHAMPFTGATWFVIAILGFVVWMFYKANMNPKSKIEWEDLVIDATTDRASPYKLGYMVGMVVATWIVLTFTDKGTLSFDILGTYLTFLLGGAGVNSFTTRNTTNVSDTSMSIQLPDQTLTKNVTVTNTVSSDPGVAALPPDIKP